MVAAGVTPGRVAQKKRKNMICPADRDIIAMYIHYLGKNKEEQDADWKVEVKNMKNVIINIFIKYYILEKEKREEPITENEHKIWKQKFIDLR